MGDLARTFTVASDSALVGLIVRARKRLVVIAPALSNAVAEAIVARLPDLGSLDITVILDADPEVYRLGFGEVEALEALRKASSAAGLGLRRQAGVRIGVVIADDETMVYAPVSKNVEAGSTSAEKPNAILLGGGGVERIAAAAGLAAGNGDLAVPEIGEAALKPAAVAEMQANLTTNPPRPFDIARKLNVFTSKVQYVELKASNYRLTKRQIPLPSELVDVVSNDLRDSINARIRLPVSNTDLEITIEHDGKEEHLKISENSLTKERKEIEDDFTFPIATFGRVILYSDKADFDSACERFRAVVEAYQVALKDKIGKSKEEFVKQLVDEYAPRWRTRPPKQFLRWKIEPTSKAIDTRLRELAGEIFDKAIDFEPPEVRILYKNLSFENLQDAKFLDALKAIMSKRRVPPEIIASLFAFGEAAPEVGSDLARARE